MAFVDWRMLQILLAVILQLRTVPLALGDADSGVSELPPLLSANAAPALLRYCVTAAPALLETSPVRRLAGRAPALASPYPWLPAVYVSHARGVRCFQTPSRSFPSQSANL